MSFIGLKRNRHSSDHWYGLRNGPFDPCASGAQLSSERRVGRVARPTNNEAAVPQAGLAKMKSARDVGQELAVASDKAGNILVGKAVVLEVFEAMGAFAWMKGLPARRSPAPTSCGSPPRYRRRFGLQAPNR